MPFKQLGESLIVRLPLACDLATRTLAAGVTYLRDTYLQNGYLESDPTTQWPNVCKRPATITGFTAGPTASVIGQGMFNYAINGVLILFAVVANTLYRITGGTIAHGSASAANWNTLTPAPVLTYAEDGSFSCIVFQNQFLTVGGYVSSTSRYSGIVSATTDGITFAQLTNAPQWATSANGRSRPNLAVLNDTLYLIGGNTSVTNSVYYNDCWYSADAINWTLATQDMGSLSGILPRDFPATVTFNGNIVLIGGQTYSGSLAYTNQVISSGDGANWTINATPPFSARKTAACVFKGAIYAVCGNDGTNDLKEVWKSTDANNWTNVYSSGITGTHGYTFFSVIVLGNLMYALAFSKDGANSHDIYSSPDGATWTLVGTGPWAAGTLLQAVVFKPPLNYSGYPQYPQPVIWVPRPSINRAYFTDLDTNYAASYAIGTAAAVSAIYDFAQVNTGQYVVLKNNTDAWYYTSNSVTQITDQNYPSSTVRGIVNLNGRAYVMDSLGNIWGSKPNDPTIWPGLNFIRADFLGDAPVAIARYGNYIVAFKSQSTMFFNDNGQSVGNTIDPIPNANALVGCGQAYSVVEMMNTIFYISTYGGLRRSISYLSGFVPTKVSSDDVDRILDGNPCTNVDALSLKMGGQEFYVLNLRDAPTATLVYNVATQKWMPWNSGADGVTTGTLPFRIINRVGLGQNSYGQDHQTNQIFQITDTSFQDTDVNGNTAITVIFQPNKVDIGSHQPKFCASVDLIADDYPSANAVLVEVSDDDGQTWTSLGSADLVNDRPFVSLAGRFVRRIHRFTHTANQPLRMQGYELTMEPGDV